MKAADIRQAALMMLADLHVMRRGELVRHVAVHCGGLGLEVRAEVAAMIADGSLKAWRVEYACLGGAVLVSLPGAAVRPL